MPGRTYYGGLSLLLLALVFLMVFMVFYGVILLIVAAFVLFLLWRYRRKLARQAEALGASPPYRRAPRQAAVAGRADPGLDRTVMALLRKRQADEGSASS